ncbi:biotin-dependent carboxylase-like uncharacterized protein [Tamaricihabitans halophyticus]|uniref:Biotin-dependent carboxylase-like uncharacterized protein n=1 Tax=Tamaricihabitans halophyticus TaxID=1262583 RepID=A0A4R2PU26_9PSEU|nr:biotin-dependent carboxyltransferase family protein [Tamaricihabitans halophyticus]TCP39367.1 biotin-dependent carboxylase-like uncharacterized protein [Tamaricihabitans halophyticus]
MTSPPTPAIEIVEPGPFSTIQDLGRHAHAHLGVPTSGAADQGAFRLANRLVGNAETAACLEITLGGAIVRFHAPASVALTGAPTAAKLDRRPASLMQRFHVQQGQTLRLDAPAYGLRTYLAVRGGIAVPATLGSRSTDTLSGLGPEPLQTGQVLPIGDSPEVDRSGLPDCATTAVPTTMDPTVRVHPGPRDDWFSPDALRVLTSETWEITAETNRVGARLSGPALEYATNSQLPSEGMVAGAIEVPPSGQPIVFLADHPTTGGYPVIGVVHAEDIGLLSQARPSTRLRFRITRYSTDLTGETSRHTHLT